MRRQNWLLLAIAASDHGLSPIQAQKSMFLMKMEANAFVGRRFYSFEPYDYGPFDQNIYNDVEAFAAEGLVDIERAPGRNWPRYKISRAGLEKAHGIRGDSDDDAVEYLDRVVDWVESRPFGALVRAIYERYPKYKVNSVFAG